MPIYLTPSKMWNTKTCKKLFNPSSYQGGWLPPPENFSLSQKKKQNKTKTKKKTNKQTNKQQNKQTNKNKQTKTKTKQPTTKQTNKSKPSVCYILFRSFWWKEKSGVGGAKVSRQRWRVRRWLPPENFKSPFWKKYWFYSFDTYCVY